MEARPQPCSAATLNPLDGVTLIVADVPSLTFCVAGEILPPLPTIRAVTSTKLVATSEAISNKSKLPEPFLLPPPVPPVPVPVPPVLLVDRVLADLPSTSPALRPLIAAQIDSENYQVHLIYLAVV